jgi:hypothetical protein
MAESGAKEFSVSGKVDFVGHVEQKGVHYVRSECSCRSRESLHTGKNQGNVVW